MSTISSRIADRFVGAPSLLQNETVAEKAKVTLLHNLSVAVAGRPLANAAYAFAAKFPAGSGQGSRLLVDGARVSMDAAVVATGALIHVRAQDDTHARALTHLGCTTLPALLMLAESEDSSGEVFLDAMIAGYETAIEIALGQAVRVTERGFRASSVFGAFASAAATSRLLRSDRDQFMSALGLASSFGGGTSQTWIAGTQEFLYQVGVASRNGLTSTMLAREGVQAAEDGIEGIRGVYNAFSGSADAAEAVAEASRWQSTWHALAVTYKPFPICVINQLPVSMLVDLLRDHGLTFDDLDQIEVRLSPGEANYPGVAVNGPWKDSAGALMSAPFTLAASARFGTVEVEHLELFEDPELCSMAQRVAVISDPTLDSSQCKLEVRLRSGTSLQAAHTADEPPFNWGRDEVVRRVEAMAPLMPFTAGRLDRFMEVCLNIERFSVRELVETTLRS